jgi:hypothetical protein
VGTEVDQLVDRGAVDVEMDAVLDAVRAVDRVDPQGVARRRPTELSRWGVVGHLETAHGCPEARLRTDVERVDAEVLPGHEAHGRQSSTPVVPPPTMRRSASSRTDGGAAIIDR